MKNPERLDLRQACPHSRRDSQISTDRSENEACSAIVALVVRFRHVVSRQQDDDVMGEVSQSLSRMVCRFTVSRRLCSCHEHVS